MKVRLPPWARPPYESSVPAEFVEKIVRRRRQMLVHCHIYYRMDRALIEDHTWQRWAEELAELQFFWGTEFGFYDPEFRDWDASTGYHLPTDSDVARVAELLVADFEAAQSPITPRKTTT